MKPFTLRTTLTLSYTAILALLLGLISVVYYHALSLQLDAEATDELSELTSAMHTYLHFDQGNAELAFDRNDPDQVAFVERASRFYQVFDIATGRLLQQSPAMVPLGLHYTPAEVQAFRDRTRQIDITTDQGRIRLSNSLLTPAPGESYLLQVGVRLQTIDVALDQFLEFLLWGAPVVLLVSIVAGRWMAGRALKPLAELASASRAIDVSALTRRVPVRGAGDELDAVALAINDTLGRLERAIADMKQFSTALAHELRTPLAALRGETELALMEARSPEDYQRGLASQIEEFDRLNRLINQLLTLARAEAGEIPLARAPVDLGALATSVVQSLEPVSRARDLTLTCEIDAGVVITGDAGWLERLLLNLIDNAIKFTPRDGRIVVRVTGQGGSARLEVRDTGIGIGPESVPHIFERFYQADASRSSESGGVGLGLSLARWIADRHGAVIEVASAPGLGSTFSVQFQRDEERHGDLRSFDKRF